jgi:hypothetical protein
MTMIYALGGDVTKKLVPSKTPDPLYQFIRKLIVYDVNSRPNWEKEDLCDTIQEVRTKSFGRKNSGMKTIPGI